MAFGLMYSEFCGQMFYVMSTINCLDFIGQFIHVFNSKKEKA